MSRWEQQIKGWARKQRLLSLLFGWETRHRVRTVLGTAVFTIKRAIVCFGFLGPCELVAWFLRVEFVIPGNPRRLGHLAAEPDYYVKRNLRLGRKRKMIFLMDKKRVANSYLLGLWERRINVWHASEKLLKQLEHLCWKYTPKSITYTYGDYRKDLETLPQYSGPALLEIPEEDRARAREKLVRAGIPEDAWFVCVHARESGYLRKMDYHSYRDSDIKTFIPAMQYLVSKGGYVVRIGDPSMQTLPALEGVLDYANSAYRSEAMDIYLMSACRFFLGTTSGPIMVAEAFNRPLALADFISLAHLCEIKDAVFLPKILFSTKEKRPLSFWELHERDLLSLIRTDEFEAAGLEFRNNSADDILELVREVLDRLDGIQIYDEEDQRLNANVDRLLTAIGFPEKRILKVGRCFVQKHRDLFVTKENVLPV